jgi:hypothetical protein
MAFAMLLQNHGMEGSLSIRASMGRQVLVAASPAGSRTPGWGPLLT